jgi:hypothetical protein
LGAPVVAYEPLDDLKFLQEKLLEAYRRRVSPEADIRFDICIVDEKIDRMKAMDLCRETIWRAGVNSTQRITCSRDNVTSIAVLHGIKGGTSLF